MVRVLSTALVTLAMLAMCPSRAFAKIDVEAIPGEPFGVAQLTIPVSAFRGPVDLDRISVVERRDRALYPAIVRGAAGKVFGQILSSAGIGIGEGQIGNVFVSFLFVGDEPLEVTLRLPEEVRLTITPMPPRGRRDQQDLVTRWWRDYMSHLQRMGADGDFPPLVQTYLASMLAARMNLPAPLLAQIGGQDSTSTTETAKSLELLMGLERMHFGLLRDTMLGKFNYAAVADQPLPPSWEALPHALPDDLAEVPIERMAMHVPQECFYLRFGTFANSLWMDRLTDEYGDLANMVTLRAYQKDIDQRNQKQTAMERDPLGDLFGGTIIADVAMIGMDTFEEEGGAIGYILEAKNNLILGNNMRKMQQKRLTEEKANGATLEVVKIAGRDVSFASTPDNRLRSFYAQDGDFHLMTNCRAIVERFFQAGEGVASLGASPEFRHGRKLMPLTREDTIFAFFSPAFFQNLMSPHYQVELRRRMQAVVDIELVQLARLAAQREGRAHETIDDLVAADLLPPGFGKRPDGSGPILAGKDVIDSMRGPRGYFLPVPDVKVEGITADEAQRAENQLAVLARDWKRMDPLMVGARRTKLDDKGLERVIIDANINPLDETKYGWALSLLGPPTDMMVLPSPSDAISVQAWLKGGMLLPRIGPHHMFVGIKDDVPLRGGAGGDGLLSLLQTLQQTPGYLGSWPTAGYLDLLPLNLGGTAPDPRGFSQLLFGLWRWQGGGFSLLSFDRRVLEETAAHLRPVRAEVPAQIRVRVANLTGLKIAGWVDEMSYDRALAASQGNVRLMRLLEEQFGLPLHEGKATAELLLDGRLVCPLGGEYGLSDDRGGGRWISTAWPMPGAPRPEFHSPIQKWFRGVDFYLSRNDTGIFAHAELDMYRSPLSNLPKVDLPIFSIFGNGQKAMKPAEDVKPPPPNGARPLDAAGPRIELPGAEPGGGKSVLKKPGAKTDELPPPPPAPGARKKGKRDF
jgi:hypothetical protein